MEKIGIMGGTFNPVHTGHLNAALCFYSELNLDRVILIPDSLPPHKEYSGGADDADRLNMLKIAVSGRTGLYVSDIEIKRGGKSYTFDTLNELRGIYKDARLFFLTGTDMFLTLDEWYRYPDILSLATFTVMPRDGKNRGKIIKARDKYKKLGYETVILSGKPVSVSSSELRKMLSFGENPGELLPSGVYEYISEKKLYVR